ncbi:MAG: hypothetical protein AAF468_12430 [Pseudomonadota bacterium]
MIAQMFLAGVAMFVAGLLWFGHLRDRRPKWARDLDVADPTPLWTQLATILVWVGLGLAAGTGAALAYQCFAGEPSWLPM